MKLIFIFSALALHSIFVQFKIGFLEHLVKFFAISLSIHWFQFFSFVVFFSPLRHNSPLNHVAHLSLIFPLNQFFFRWATFYLSFFFLRWNCLFSFVPLSQQQQKSPSKPSFLSKNSHIFSPIWNCVNLFHLFIQSEFFLYIKTFISQFIPTIHLQFFSSTFR